MKSFHWYSTVALLPVLLFFFTACGPSTPPDQLLQSAMEKAKVQDWEGALADARSAEKILPDDASVLMMCAIAGSRTGNREQALADARRAAELYPENFYAQYLLGRLYSEGPAADQEAAFAALRIALQLRGNDENTRLLLAICGSKLDKKSAITYYHSLSPANKARPELLCLAADYFVRRNNPDMAAGFYRDAYLAAPNQPKILLNFARFADYYLHHDKAPALYQKYLNLTAGNPEYTNSRSVVEARLAQLKRQ